MNAKNHRYVRENGEGLLFTGPFVGGAPPVPRPNTVVTLASLSGRVPDTFICETFSQALRAETGKSVLLLHLQREPGRLTLSDWEQLGAGVNREFVLNDRLDTTEGGVEIVRMQLPDETSVVDFLPKLIGHCGSYFHYVIVHVAVDLPLGLLLKSFACSSCSFLLLHPNSEDLYYRDLLFREFRGLTEIETRNVKSIICREKGVERRDALGEELIKEIHGFVNGCPSRSASYGLRRWLDRDFNAGIRRLAREVGRRRVGLALSSGGARGLAHIGVIQVLEEHGIEVDVVAGCSMGSYIGAVWAYGYDGVAMERLSREVEHRWGLFELVDPFLLPRQGFLRGEKVKARLKKSIGDVPFSELVRPLRIVATHLASLDRVVFSSGEVAQAVHASSAIPGACVPVSIDGELYIDGGIADPLPVDVLSEMGIEKIIAINTIPTPAYLRARLDLERERDIRRGRKSSPIGVLLNKYLNYFAPGNILDTILRSFNGAQMQVAEHSCQAADVVIRPLSFDGRWHDFRRPGKYIAIGRREAEQHIDQIKSLVSQKEPTYEVPFVQQSVATPA